MTTAEEMIKAEETTKTDESDLATRPRSTVRAETPPRRALRVKTRLRMGGEQAGNEDTT